MRRIVIDTDPGIDDAYAILAALSCEEIKVEGICTVSGNKGIDIVTANALRLTQFLKQDVPVYQGAAASLQDLTQHHLPKRDADAFHGTDGMGGSGLAYDTHNLIPTNAWQFLLDCIKAHPYEIEILALGPLTNLALAIQKDVATMKKVKAIWSMGGGIYRGNVTQYAEFNYWFDAPAADIVYRTLQDTVPMYMIGLDATHTTLMTHDNLAFIRYEGDRTGELLYQITQQYLRQYYLQNGYLGAVLHDLIAFLYMIEPEIATSSLQHGKIEVICDGEKRGQTVFTNDVNGKSTAILSCDNTLCNRLLIQLLFKEKIERYLQYTNRQTRK